MLPVNWRVWLLVNRLLPSILLYLNVMLMRKVWTTGVIIWVSTVTLLLL